jgi:hypothetical protein
MSILLLKDDWILTQRAAVARMPPSTKLPIPLKPTCPLYLCLISTSHCCGSGPSWIRILVDCIRIRIGNEDPVLDPDPGGQK